MCGNRDLRRVAGCVPAGCDASDADADGFDSIPCGGNDCDDSDPLRNPGVEEICDAAGVDDCNPDTLGSADADGDGHVSRACCNGTACGTDCDDSDASVHPDVSERCDGVDNDCSGAADDASPMMPLCPGGTCGGGRCMFTPFDRVFRSSGGNDTASGLAIDALGNLYVGGTFGSTVDFGAGTDSSVFVASFTPAGVLRWPRPGAAPGRYSGEGWAAGLDVSVDTAGGLVYVLTSFFGSITFGPNTLEAPTERHLALVALDLEGVIQWARLLPPSRSRGRRSGGVWALGDRVYVASSFGERFDFGGDIRERLPQGNIDGYLLAFDRTGTPREQVFFGAPGASVHIEALTGGLDGRLVLAGDYDGTVDFGSGTPWTGTGSGFVLVREPGVGRVWDQTFSAVVSARVLSAAASRTRVFIGARIRGRARFGGGADAIAPEGVSTAVIVAYDDTGAGLWSRALDRPMTASLGTADPLGITANDDGVVVVGSYVGTVDFGGGGLTSTFDGTLGISTLDVFVACYGPDGLHLADRSYGGIDPQYAIQVVTGPGGSTNIVGEFQGTIDLGSGDRTSTGGSWGYVARLRE